MTRRILTAAARFRALRSQLSRRRTNMLRLHVRSVFRHACPVCKHTRLLNNTPNTTHQSCMRVLSVRSIWRSSPTPSARRATSAPSAGTPPLVIEMTRTACVRIHAHMQAMHTTQQTGAKASRAACTSARSRR